MLQPRVGDDPQDVQHIAPKECVEAVVHVNVPGHPGGVAEVELVLVVHLEQDLDAVQRRQRRLGDNARHPAGNERLGDRHHGPFPLRRVGCVRVVLPGHLLLDVHLE